MVARCRWTQTRQPTRPSFIWDVEPQHRAEFAGVMDARAQVLETWIKVKDPRPLRQLGFIEESFFLTYHD